MTMRQILHPAVLADLDKFDVQFDVLECDPQLADTAAFCEHYKIPAEETCNAILVASKTEPVKYACCVVLATCKLDVNKKACQLLEVKRCSFAGAEPTLQLTQMQIGGVAPVGLKDVPVFIDAAVKDKERVVLGGGNRSSKLLIAPSELEKLPYISFVQGLGIPL